MSLPLHPSSFFYAKYRGKQVLVHKLVLHTIAIGEFQKEFLQALAVENSGVFVDLGR